MEFGDLKDDKKIQDGLLNFHNSVHKIENVLNGALNIDVYETLSTEEKVNYDLFMAYTLNTLLWLYLRTKGVDPNTSEIKNQLNRIRQYMVKSKQAHDRNTIRPTLNQAAAKRFIKHGVHNSSKIDDEPPTKKLNKSHS